MAQSTELVEVRSLKGRYGDAYIVARVTVTVGKLFKGIGIVIAALVIIGAAIAGIKLGYEASNAPYPLQGRSGYGRATGFRLLSGRYYRRCSHRRRTVFAWHTH